MMKVWTYDDLQSLPNDGNRYEITDLLVVREERRGIFEKRGAVAAPDLVVEVLSPSNTRHDRVTKRRFYARNGIREYWIVDPEAETFEVLQLIEGGLSYRQAGWYGPGDRARSATFELQVDDATLRLPRCRTAPRPGARRLRKVRHGRRHQRQR